MSNLPKNEENAGIVRSLVRWFDSDYIPEGAESFRSTPKQVDWPRTIPFIILHLGCLGVIWVGVSSLAVWLAVGLYFFRMFAITGFLHRYFSHKTYSTSRAFQFIMALWCSLAVQRGALWWAYTHRHHHKHSDEEEDKHSPVVDGFWWAHIGWITSKKNFPTDYSKITDLAKYPELVFLNRFDTLVPILFAGSLYGLGAYLGAHGVETSGGQLLVWGFFISTTVLFHGTSCINSLAHVWGTKRFKTTDDESRNSFILTLITLGEGWHNNHHRYQATTKQGFYWWEFDPTYYLLKMLSWTGLIWGLKGVPESVYEEAEKTKAESQQRA
ncbi:MAG: acyl-CoA desaturase [Opitutae bacterium]|nr:acyl-CoA desaturase [Opitutae bacterium]NBY42957.1 acyl-CoA desaturase [Verrucomicrobiota bacterium]